MSAVAGRGPNFLGIGVPRGGSTWLHELLDTHPDVWLPSAKRKEIHYFDMLATRRDDAWYRAVFEPGYLAGAAAIGEITPTYFAAPHCAEHIRASLPDLHRLLLIVREPARRMWSEYHWNCRNDNYTGSLAEFLRDKPEFAARSHYGASLRHYLEVFPPDELLVLVAEEAFADPETTRAQLAAFLGIDPLRFPADAGHARVNEGGMPRFRRTYAFASSLRRAAWRADLDVLPNLARRLGLKKLLLSGSTQGTPPPAAADALVLDTRYAADRAAIEEHLGRPIAAWRPLSEQVRHAGEDGPSAAARPA